MSGLEGGRAGSAPPLPLGRQTDAVTHRKPTPDMTTVLYYGESIASLSLQTRKTWHSDYSKLLPPVAALECTKFVFGRGSAQTRWGGGLQRSPRRSSWFKGTYV